MKLIDVKTGKEVLTADTEGDAQNWVFEKLGSGQTTVWWVREGTTGPKTAYRRHPIFIWKWVALYRLEAQ